MATKRLTRPKPAGPPKAKTYTMGGGKFVGKLHTYGHDAQAGTWEECKWVIRQFRTKEAPLAGSWESDKLPFRQAEAAIAQAEAKFFACDAPVQATIF